MCYDQRIGTKDGLFGQIGKKNFMQSRIAGIRAYLDHIAPAMTRDAVDSRLARVLQIEWALLALRYAILFIVVAAYAIGSTPYYTPDLRIVAAMVILHNALAHWVLFSGRFSLFLSPANFVIYLIDVSLAVGLTGAEESPIALLYVLFIIGYSTYVPHFLNTFMVTLICCACYAFTVLVKWVIVGVNLENPPIGVHLAAILVCGWMLRTLGAQLRAARLEAQSQAQALASSRAAIRAILDSTAEPILVYGDNEFITDVNDRACEFFGLPREQLLGKRFRAFLFDDGALANRFANLRARGEFHGEALALTQSGEERNVDLLVRSFIRDNQRFFVAMLHDITRQKNLQEASRMANLRLEQINRELQQVNQMRRAFIRTVSQRLRSPLSAILGFIEMLLNEELGEINPEQRSALQSARRGMHRVFNLVDQPFDILMSEEQQEPHAEDVATPPAATAESGISSSSYEGRP